MCKYVMTRMLADKDKLVCLKSYGKRCCLDSCSLSGRLSGYLLLIEDALKSWECIFVEEHLIFLEVFAD